MAMAFDLWQGQTSWISAGDILLLAGALLAAGLVVYGAWLCIAEADPDPHEATGDDRRIQKS
jgi:hypothetical protein